MKHIKTFENFFKRWFEKPRSSKIGGNFNNSEIKELKELNFDNSEHSDHKYSYKSDSSNLYIEIYKYYEDSEIPGDFNSYYIVKYNIDEENNYFSGYNFEKIISKIKELIPEEDSNIKKYNL